jgi:3-hydroxy-3-methylglutaryl CoA synthase/uncharacterized OB-fold protein
MSPRLLAYAAYLPAYVLPRSQIESALGIRAGNGVRSVAGYDEDAITMAVAALRRLPESVRDTRRLFLATSAPALLDKTNAAIVQAAAGGRESALTADLVGLSSGFAALVCAQATAGVAALGDVRTGRPGSRDESDGGDGAAAFAFGDGDDAVAEVLAVSSRALSLMDIWRGPGGTPAESAEERLVASVHSAAVAAVVEEVLDAAAMDDRPLRAVVAAPQRRLAITLSARWGREADVQVRHRENVGFCGAADVGRLLAGALDASATGDTILLVSAASTVDAMLLRVLRDGHSDDGDRGARTVGYPSFLTWRGWLDREPARRPEPPVPSAAATYRGRAWKFGLTGSQCQRCAAVWLPPQRVCGVCCSAAFIRPYSVVDRPARLSAVSTDGLADTPAPPARVGVVDFEGGGRMTAEITDEPQDEPQVGDRVEMVFRRTQVRRGVPDYFWKARRLPGGER